MGTWGPGIFADDLASDVQGTFRDLIGQGVEPAEATDRLVDEYCPDGDLGDGPVFWLALAATQWRLGRLEERVRDRALQVIADGADLRRWEDETTNALARKRRAALEQLRQQLLTPPPPAKRVPARYIAETEFEPGDLVSYRLLSERHILLRVVQIHGDRGGDWPEVEIVDCNGDTVNTAEASDSGPRRPLPSAAKTGRFKTRFWVFRRSKREFPASRLKVLARSLPITPLPGPSGPEWAPGIDPEHGHRRDPKYGHPDYGNCCTTWRELDSYLQEGFGLE